MSTRYLCRRCRSIDDRDTGAEPTARARGRSAGSAGAERRSGHCLTLHELATNAVKYGALSAANGRVDLKWSHDWGGQLHLRWTETGGPKVHEPVRKGFWRTNY